MLIAHVSNASYALHHRRAEHMHGSHRHLILTVKYCYKDPSGTLLLLYTIRSNTLAERERCYALREDGIY